MKRIVVFGAVICLLFLLLIPGAGASDGVLEINQACAVNTGCFTGDSVGFPVEIDGSVGRSYRLTSDLILPSSGVTGIIIFVPSVSIDLNGFEIVSLGCLGATEKASCVGPPEGNGDGIAYSGPADTNVHGISVRNGSITGMGDDGLKLGKQARIINVRSRWNGYYGLAAREGSIIEDSSSYENNVGGIYTPSGVVVSDNNVYGNSSFGIDTENGSLVSGNTIYGNGGTGIEAGRGSAVSGNTVYENGGDGIAVQGGSTVSGNTVHANSEQGLNLSGTPGVDAPTYRNNSISGNTIGTVSGGVNAGGNVCNGTTTCP